MLTFKELTLARDLVQELDYETSISNETLTHRLGISARSATYEKIRSQLARALIIQTHGKRGFTRLKKTNLMELYLAINRDIETSEIGDMVRELLQKVEV